ncbi:MAG: hypothetical protein ACM3P1_00785 [Candidatus Saccharibacteria bacterium]
MKITRDNYESFFLDYLEGTLEETMIDQFLDFLEQHPDLKEELNLFEEIPLPQEPLVFKDKQALYKTPGRESEAFDRKAVAYMEGDLKEHERCSFEASLERNPKLKQEYALLEKTRLTADTTIHYPDKQKLYRKSATILLINWAGRAAAVLILLIGVYSLLQRGGDTRIPVTTEVASVKTPSSTPAVTTEPKVSEPVTNSKDPVAKAVRPVNKVHQKVTKTASESVVEQSQAPGELLAARTISPIPAHLESEQLEMALVPFNRPNNQRFTNGRTVMTLDEYLAFKAKKATNEGILSANRLLRVGLNVASEISGDRLGYTVKNGKVASLDFESKLLAFEIPLEKKN